MGTEHRYRPASYRSSKGFPRRRNMVKILLSSHVFAVFTSNLGQVPIIAYIGQAHPRTNLIDFRMNGPFQLADLGAGVDGNVATSTACRVEQRGHHQHSDCGGTGLDHLDFPLSRTLGHEP